MRSPTRNLVVAALAAGLLGGCVAVSEEMAASSETMLAARPDFEPLDPGAYRHETLHFEVQGYGREPVSAASKAAEDLYRTVMEDTGLYSFRPKNLYQILIYGSREEYLAKTKMPEWSAGVTIDNALCTFEHPGWERTLAHEMTHLIFNEFVGRRAHDFVWLNEGLAMYEEHKALDEGYRARFRARSRSAVQQLTIPFRQMVQMIPATEQERDINQWYLQVESVVRYMVETGGRLGFSLFLEALRDGARLDDALQKGFPGVWNGIDGLERGWAAKVRGR